MPLGCPGWRVGKNPKGRGMVCVLAHLASVDQQVPAADRLKLYLAIMGLVVIALFALVLLTVIRRVTSNRGGPSRAGSRPMSAWEAAGKRARPEGGDPFLPQIYLGGGGGGGGGRGGKSQTNDRTDSQHDGNDGAGGGGGGDGGGGGGGGDGGGGGGD